MEDSRRAWAEEGTSLVRGVSGGLIVGIPLLYTMEMWFLGITLADWVFPVILIGTLILALPRSVPASDVQVRVESFQAQ